jgi:hypothetical protein
MTEKTMVLYGGYTIQGLSSDLFLLTLADLTWSQINSVSGTKRKEKRIGIAGSNTLGGRADCRESLTRCLGERAARKIAREGERVREKKWNAQWKNENAQWKEHMHQWSYSDAPSNTFIQEQPLGLWHRA